MIRLLRIELTKIIYNRTFWIILGLYVLLMVPIAFQLEDFLNSISINGGADPKQEPGVPLGSMLLQNSSIFSYPDVWHYISYLASWFKLLLAIILIINITDEYSYKTLRQNIIDGMNKWEIIGAKQLVILLLSSFAVIMVIVVTLIVGSAAEGVNITEGSSIVLSYFFSLILYLNFAYLLCTWLKKSGFVISILFLYTLVIENLISFQIPDNVSQFLPMNLLESLVPNPVQKILGQSVGYTLSATHIGASLVYTSFFIVLIYWMLKKGHVGK
ncbi:MAG: ABC transporter permease subunit [Flavobacteriales bacterium]|nr:ABC transporter permease subunit [Flavobacteriales bacterium]